MELLFSYLKSVYYASRELQTDTSLSKIIDITMEVEPSKKDILAMRRPEPLGRLIEKVESLIKVDFPQQSLKETVTKVAEGALVAVVGNHQSHCDIVSLGMVTYIITEAINKGVATGQYSRTDHFPGFIVPMAASVATGDQSRLITAFYNQMTDWLKSHHIRPVLVVREKDVKRYGLNPLAKFSSLKQALNQTNTTTGLGIFPEGSVEGGKQIPDSNQRYGIIEVPNSTLLSEQVIRAKTEGKKMIIVPIGISGTYTLFDPDTMHPTLTAFKTLMHNQLWPGNPLHLATVSVGEPFLSDDLPIPELDGSKASPEIHRLVNYQILRRVSQLLPPEERGIFRDV
jgi:1-acyl-sn-glycerol-3-phosphate acyltransferase